MTSSNGQHFNYCVKFSDRTVKTGVSSAPFFRLQDFIQEAHRHSKKVTGFTFTPPLRYKPAAHMLERWLCEQNSMYVIDGHREWFLETLQWCSPKTRRLVLAMEDWSGLYFDIAREMYEKWTHFYVRYDWLRYGRSEQDWIKDPVSRYRPAVKFAEELVASGSRISATKATALAAEMVAA